MIAKSTLYECNCIRIQNATILPTVYICGRGRMSNLGEVENEQWRSLGLGFRKFVKPLA